jgi:uncharacterized protein
VSNAETSPPENSSASEPIVEPAPSPTADLWETEPSAALSASQPTALGSDGDRFNLASASLRSTLARYQETAPAGLQSDVQVLNDTLAKLDGGIYCIAVFGLVSRGKSAVLNALLGEKVLEVGPLNGVTKFPRSVRWQASPEIQIDLIDTPGLDEIDGESRAQMAQEIASKADLILLIVAGDITQLEYRALCELRAAQKPLLLVFNKSDIYPEQERQSIYQQLQKLGDEMDPVNSELIHRLLSAEEVVMVAADPAPIQVRIEYPDGSSKNEWEATPAQIEPLKTKILGLLEREGRSLLAINALVQARSSENKIAVTTLQVMGQEAEQLIWRFAQYKALAILLSPIVFLDVLGGMVVDLVMVKSLAKLYNLPLTTHETKRPLMGILFSGGSLLLGEIFTTLLFGFGKGELEIASFNLASAPGYLAGGIAQGLVAGYGAYAVGRAAQIYLAKGSTWGKMGANTVIREILQTIDDQTIVSRLREELVATPEDEAVAPAVQPTVDA